MQPVDESVRFVELVTEAGYPAPGHHGSVTLDAPRASFGRFHFLGDFVDLGVQRLQQLPCLRGVGVVNHVGIIAPTAAKCAPRTDQQPLRSTWTIAARNPSYPCSGNDRAVAY